MILGWDENCVFDEVNEEFEERLRKGYEGLGLIEEGVKHWDDGKELERREKIEREREIQKCE